MTARRNNKLDGRLFAIGDIHGCPSVTTSIAALRRAT